MLQPCALNKNPRQMELRPHGTAEFPCGGYDTAVRPTEGGGIAWHWHEEAEMLFVTEGTVQVCLPDCHWSLEPGEGAFINANVLHSLQAEGEGGRVRSAVFHIRLVSGGSDTVFYRKYVSPLLEYSGIKGLRLTSELDWQKEMLSEIRQATSLLEERKDGYEWEVRAALSRFWRILYENTRPKAAENQRQSIDAQRLRKMLELIWKEYSHPLGLEQIARAANIGQRECLRCFQRTIGVSPLQYLLRYRVSQAAALLRETDLPVAEIGIRCGFDDPSHFAQTFRKYFLLTPSAYRKGRV